MFKKILLMLVFTIPHGYASEHRRPSTVRRRAYSLGTIHTYEHAVSHASRVPTSWQIHLSKQLQPPAPTTDLTIVLNVYISIEERPQQVPETQLHDTSYEYDDNLGTNLGGYCAIL